MRDIKEQLFRKVSLERLSSPEQLDTLMRVITPNAWLALLPLLGLILLAAAWGWYGSVPTKVAGKCILINPTGLAEGTSVLNVERSGSGEGHLEAVVYVPAADGHKVEPGMAAEVTPSTIKREEHGFMRARITSVSDYPATAQSMMRVLQNENLVKVLAGSAPVEIRAALYPAANPSGYEWSSPQGAPIRIRSGTLCNGEIVVKRQRPVTLVIPMLKKSLGLD